MKLPNMPHYQFLLLSLALLLGSHQLPAAKEKSQAANQESAIEVTKGPHLSENQEHVLHADHLYVETFGDKAELTMFSKDKFVILTCMDSRIDPAKFAGLAEGDAYVIRNAGARASDDAIRSITAASKLLGIKEIFVIAHTDCAMEKFTDDIMRRLYKGSLGLAVQDSHGKWRNVKNDGGSTEAFYIDWLTINHGLRNSVVMDVRRIRNHPLVSGKITIYGYIYDVHTGKLIPVPEAMRIGKPTKN